MRGRRDPLCSLDRSDSANLDAVFEHLRRNTDIEPAMAIGMLVPEAYREQPDYDKHPEVSTARWRLDPATSLPR